MQEDQTKQNNLHVTETILRSRMPGEFSWRLKDRILWNKSRTYRVLSLLIFLSGIFGICTVAFLPEQVGFLIAFGAPLVISIIRGIIGNKIFARLPSDEVKENLADFENNKLTKLMGSDVNAKNLFNLAKILAPVTLLIIGMFYLANLLIGVMTK